MSSRIEREVGPGSRSVLGDTLEICVRTRKTDLLVFHSHRIILFNDTTPSFTKFLGF
jgi:hypothetical protein